MNRGITPQRTLVMSALLTASLTACGGSTGTHPHDSSAHRHDEAAVGEERESTREEPCGAASASAAARQVDVPCWTALDPAEVARHREAAAAHRAAAQALRDAEASSCAGIDEADRDISPFDHRADLLRVAPLEEVGAPDAAPQVVGARIVFRATPGLTAQWLQREVDCHLARNAALGHEVPEMDYCPLVPRGASAQVTALSDGFAVDVRGDSPASIQQIVDRANRLLGP